MIADKLLKKIQDSQPNVFDGIKFFDLFMIVPYFKSLGKTVSLLLLFFVKSHWHAVNCCCLGKQTVDRLKSFIHKRSQENEGFLQGIQPDLSSSRVEDHVIRNASRGEDVVKGSEREKAEKLKNRIKKEKSTLFFIVHDEAHFAPIRGKLVDSLINDPEIAQAKNVILLQVSATPYNLITSNSRINDENRLDMFKEMTAGEEGSQYYGIKDFVENTLDERTLDDQARNRLKPGTLTKDNDFENMISPPGNTISHLRKYVTEKFDESTPRKKKKSGKGDVEHKTRLYGFVLQWIGALLEKAKIDPGIFRSKLANFIRKCDITKDILQDIDSDPNGKGPMTLVRVLNKKEGRFFVESIRGVRDALGYSKKFSVIIDDESNTREANELCEEAFLKRLQMWNDNGNPNYRPSSYNDLKDLPLILVVVEKGKMGITYPKTLRYYDLRMRYATTKATTRSAMEQDFGRACRYISPGDPPLPTVIVSAAAESQLVSARSTRQKGVYSLNPDYMPKFMQKPKEMCKTEYSKGSKMENPANDFDLAPYKKYEAGREKNTEHCDYANKEQLDNRYLLIGRPQIGKTGVFLHLAYLLWHEAGQPRSNGPEFDQAPTIQVEVVSDEDDDDGDDVTEPSLQILENMQEFPNFQMLKEKKLEKPCVSQRYGDPNSKEVRDWYLEEPWNQYPFPGALKPNSLYKRTTQTQSISTGSSGATSELPNQEIHNIVRHNKFYSKQATYESFNSQVDFERRVAEEFHKYATGNTGTLFIRKSEALKKWDLPNGEKQYPVLQRSLKLPPILMPSSGRAQCALLDLSPTMEGEKSYVQIVVVREEEKDEYLKVALGHKAMDVFVMEDSNKTIGKARSVSKIISELITEDTGIDFAFMMDDNISHWSGVTLINDPCRLFGKDPSHETSQVSDISLYHVLKHFSTDNFKRINDFSVLGFGTFHPKGIKRKKLAYARKHVYAAVFLNLRRLRGVEYNPRAWAMEDTDFNNKTHASSGVIVKCMRYISTKKFMNTGGVVPTEVPDHVRKLLDENEFWRKHPEPEKEKGARRDDDEKLTPDQLKIKEMEEEIEKVKAAAAADVKAYQQLLAERDSEIARLKEGTVNGGSNNTSQEESSGSASNPSQKKRKSTDDATDLLKHKLEKAKASKILPEGLTRVGTGMKVTCEICATNYGDCSSYPNPFKHFVDFLEQRFCGKQQVCHVCEFYRKDLEFMKLGEFSRKLDKGRGKRKQKK